MFTLRLIITDDGLKLYVYINSGSVMVQLWNHLSADLSEHLGARWFGLSLQLGGYDVKSSSFQQLSDMKRISRCPEKLCLFISHHRFLSQM